MQFVDNWNIIMDLRLFMFGILMCLALQTRAVCSANDVDLIQSVLIEMKTLKADMLEERRAEKSRIDTLEQNQILQQNRIHALEEELKQVQKDRHFEISRISELEKELEMKSHTIDILSQKLIQFENVITIAKNFNVNGPALENSDSVKGHSDNHESHKQDNLDTINGQPGPKTADRTAEISNQNRRMKRQIISETTDHVAFSVGLSGHAAGLGSHQVIPFDQAIINEGDAFDTATHTFVCPITGVYLFQSSLMAHFQQFVQTEIAKEGVRLAVMYAGGSTTGHGFDQGFNSVITTCTKGEMVQVRFFEGGTVYSGHYSSFSGYLLWV